MQIARPTDEECPAFYRAYVNNIPEGDVVEFLRNQQIDFVRFILEIPQEKQKFRYQPEKWTIHEVLGHVIDTERILAFRALAFSRGEAQEIPGYDDMKYVENANFNQLPTAHFSLEFEWVRASNLAMINALNEEMFDRYGVANGVSFSVRALIYIMGGHVAHHKNIIINRYLT